MGIGTEATRGPQPRAVACEATHGGTYRLGGTNTAEHQSSKSNSQCQSEDKEDDHHVVGDMRRDGHAVKAHRRHSIGMQSVT